MGLKLVVEVGRVKEVIIEVVVKAQNWSSKPKLGHWSCGRWWLVGAWSDSLKWACESDYQH